MFQDTNQSNVKPDGGAASSSFSYDTFKAEETIANIWDKPTSILSTIKDDLNKLIGLESVGKAIGDLDAKSASLIQVLGVGKARGVELTQTIADTIPKYLELGLSADDVTKDYTDLVNKFNVNMKLTDQQLVELAATAKVTGQAGEEMAKSFQDVGVPLSLVGDRMMDVVTIANQAGVTVGSVSAGVVKNLDKMNIYNFEGGVKGLAKMAAQASRLGISMDKIFGVVDKVFDPEGAIELAASLQRLGVQTSEMLDPLRLMDLAQNDPTELQNQIVGMTKQFTRFNEVTGQFEILPGAKRQMNEVAKAMDMTAGEFQKMALNAANFDAKLKQINFSPDIKEEDRELVATMAQINKDGVAEVKVKKVDEEGNLTGEEAMVETSKLTAKQIEYLKEQQKLEGKTMEQIGLDQLSYLARLNGSVNRLGSTIVYGAASREDVQNLVKEGATMATKAVNVANEKISTKDIRNLQTDDIFKALQEMFSGIDFSVEGMTELFSTGVDKLFNMGKDAFNNTSEYMSDLFSFDNTTSPSSTNKNVNTNLTTTSSTTTPKTTAENYSINMAHVFDFKNVPPNLTTTEVTNIMKEWATNPINANSIFIAASKVNSGLLPT